MTSPSRKLDNPICRPIQGPTVDQPRTHSLPRTPSPQHLFNQTITQHAISTFQAGDKKSSESSQTLRTTSTRQAAELWMNKYEYVKRDNQLLTSQIVYLNQQIRQLCQTNQNTQKFFKECLERIQKITKKEIDSCQDRLLQVLNSIEGKQAIIEEKLSAVKEGLATMSRNVGNKEEEEIWGIRVQNMKLRTKVKALEEEIGQQDRKYVDSLNWNSQYLPSLERFQFIFASTMFSSSPCRSSTIPVQCPRNKSNEY